MTDTPEILRLIGDLVRIGTVADVDLEAARCTVSVGKITTPPLPWLALRAGATRTWSPPSVGEQVLLLCPEADVGLGVVLPGLFSDAVPSPSQADISLLIFEDGAQLSYDAADHLLIATLPANGRIRIVAPGGVRIEADAGVTVTGTLSVSDNVQIGNGATGTFTTPTGQIVIVQDGIITGIS